MAIVMQSNDASYREPIQNRVGTDLPSTWTCTECDYSCGNKTTLQCHMTAAHGMVSCISRCVDTVWCTVCGLLFDSEAGVMEHAGKTKLCRHNLLFRGPHLDDEGHSASLARRAEARRNNIRRGVSHGKVQNLCVRTFGPHQIILDEHGEEVVASKRGHPLGPNKPLHLPSGLLCPDLDDVPGCQASRYSSCTGACLLCEGSFDDG